MQFDIPDTHKKYPSEAAITPPEECKKARAKALRLLEHMDRTERGLTEKLRQAGFSPDAVTDALSYVRSFGYLDDTRYAEVYLRSRISSKSRQQLFQELQRKGVDRATIQSAWESVSDLENPDERAIIRTELLKKYSPGTALDERAMRRLQAYFARRGFHYEDVLAILTEQNIYLQRESY